jgi:hypothetical protein
MPIRSRSPKHQVHEVLAANLAVSLYIYMLLIFTHS